MHRRDLAIVQQYEQKANDAVIVLESNTDILNSLLDFYGQLVDDEDFPMASRASCRKAVEKFILQIREIIFDTRMQSARAKVLVSVVAQRKEIVSACSSTVRVRLRPRDNGLFYVVAPRGTSSTDAT